MAYAWRSGYPARVTAEVAGAVMDSLSAQGRLTARDLLDDSRPEDAPLHGAFTWDDAKAAEQYRLGEARQMIGAIQIQRVESPPVRKYFNITRQTEQYHPIEVLMATETSRSLFLESARKEFDTYRNKYQTLTELAELFEAGDVVFT